MAFSGDVAFGEVLFVFPLLALATAPVLPWIVALVTGKAKAGTAGDSWDSCRYAMLRTECTRFYRIYKSLELSG